MVGARTGRHQEEEKIMCRLIWFPPSCCFESRPQQRPTALSPAPPQCAAWRGKGWGMMVDVDMGTEPPGAAGSDPAAPRPDTCNTGEPLTAHCEGHCTHTESTALHPPRPQTFTHPGQRPAPTRPQTCTHLGHGPAPTQATDLHSPPAPTQATDLHSPPALTQATGMHSLPALTDMLSPRREASLCSLVGIQNPI